MGTVSERQYGEGRNWLIKSSIDRDLAARMIESIDQNNDPKKPMMKIACQVAASSKRF